MDDKTRRTPAEVAADASVEHSGKGVLNQVKGSAKEVWGDITGDSSKKVEGKVDQLKGKAQTKLGKYEAKEAELESGGRIRNDDDEEVCMDQYGNRTPEDVAAEHRGKGILKQMKGNLREAWGTLTGNRKHTIGGKVDRVKGRVEEGFGDLIDPNRGSGTNSSSGGGQTNF